MALELVVPVAPAAAGGTGASPHGTGGGSAGRGQGTVRRLGLLSNRKRHGDIVLDELARRLEGLHPGLAVLSRSKPNYSLPAPPEVLRELAAGCDAVLSSIGD